MKRIASTFLLVLLAVTSMAQSLNVISDETRLARQNFQNRKFGIFIHWGIYSMMADGEWVMWNRRINRDEYAKLAGGFCPAWFSAREWARLFREAGAQYVTFTARHHDGFSMWETKTSSYNVVDATPYRRDVLKAISDACREQGIKLHLYYSHMDWYRPDYPLGNTSKELPHDEKTTDWDSYYAFMNTQLTELLTNYGPIGAVWFDGMWDHPEEGFDWRLKEQYALIKKLQPKCLIGNNHHGTPVDGEDFQLFEQDLPGQNTAGFNGAAVSQLPLETCMTMNNTWGYSITDLDYKSGDEIIRRLVTAAGMDCNFLLNIGPRPDGQLPDQALAVLEELAVFMRTNSLSIQGTRGGCVPPQEWGVTTQNGNKLYIHVLNKEKDGKVIHEGLKRINGGPLSFFLPLPAGRVLKSAELRSDRTRINFERENDGYRIYLPKRPTTVDCVINAIID